MEYEFIDPATLPKPRGRYSQVVRAGNLVFIAGQTAVDLDGEMVGDGDPKAQARQVYANLKTAIESVGGKASDIVKTTTYPVDRELIPGIREAREGFFGAALPTSTLLIVAGLARPELLIEVEAVAILDN